jgi:hypothetical protein
MLLAPREAAQRDRDRERESGWDFLAYAQAGLAGSV